MGSASGSKVVLGHVKCVPDHADHGQENQKNAVRGQEMPAWRGGGRDGIATAGEMGSAKVCIATDWQSLTRPITTHTRATKLAGWGLCRSAWASPAAAGHVLRAPEVAAAVGAHFLPLPIDPKRDPRQLRWPGSPGLLFVAWLAGCPSHTPLPVCPHPTQRRRLSHLAD